MLVGQVTEKEIEEKQKGYQKYVNTRTINDQLEHERPQAMVCRNIAKKNNYAWESSCQRIKTYIGGKKKPS